MQQQALVAASQGHYLTPVTLAQIPQAVAALAAPTGISTATMTPTTASLANGESEFHLLFCPCVHTTVTLPINILLLTAKFAAIFSPFLD